MRHSGPKGLGEAHVHAFQSKSVRIGSRGADTAHCDSRLCVQCQRRGCQLWKQKASKGCAGSPEGQLPHWGWKCQGPLRLGLGTPKRTGPLLAGLGMLYQSICKKRAGRGISVTPRNYTASSHTQHFSDSSRTPSPGLWHTAAVRTQRVAQAGDRH